MADPEGNQFRVERTAERVQPQPVRFANGFSVLWAEESTSMAQRQHAGLRYGRARWRRVFSALPQVAMSHQRRRPALDVSR